MIQTGTKRHDWFTTPARRSGLVAQGKPYFRAIGHGLFLDTPLSGS
jgi:hypothetical protein